MQHIFVLCIARKIPEPICRKQAKCTPNSDSVMVRATAIVADKAWNHGERATNKLSCCHRVRCTVFSMSLKIILCSLWTTQFPFLSSVLDKKVEDVWIFYGGRKKDCEWITNSICDLLILKTNWNKTNHMHLHRHIHTQIYWKRTPRSSELWLYAFVLFLL